MVDVVKRLDDADKESALLQSKLEALQCTFPRELPASITRDTPSGALGYYRCGASATTHKAAAAFSTYHSSVSITPPPQAGALVMQDMRRRHGRACGAVCWLRCRVPHRPQGGRTGPQVLAV